MGLNIRKATKKDLEIIDELYVLNSAEEVKQQFPKKTKKSILNEFKEHQKSRQKSFLAELNQSNVIFVIAEFENKIVGFWKINDENCLVDHIEGNRYLIINERNNKFYGEFNKESQKIILDNNLVGKINSLSNKIIWNNGSIWNR